MTDTTDTTTSPTATASPELVATVDTYLASLNELDEERRAGLVRTAWAEDGAFFDPLAEAVGHEALGNLTAQAQAMFPGARFVRTSGIDTHHGILRFAWQLVGADDAVVVDGIDIGVVGDDGRLTRIAGFYGPVVPMER